jgi:hypothetical protein
VGIYSMPFIYRLSAGGVLSITKLRQALQLVIIKHQTLRTSLIFDADKNVLMQRIIELSEENNKLFTFVESIFETDEELTKIMHDERDNLNHFDLTRGLVFRCHFVHYKQISRSDLLCGRDALIFNFHHASFDFPSLGIFHRELDQAYTTDQLTSDDDRALRYIDCKFTILFFFI